MQHKAHSIRTFIGAKNFEESRKFYQELGFNETVIDAKMSYFSIENLGFYLQDYYRKAWAHNTMIFLEVDDVQRYWNELNALGLHEKYKHVKLSAIRNESWGRECFMHDPSGILWHFGQFNK